MLLNNPSMTCRQRRVKKTQYDYVCNLYFQPLYKRNNENLPIQKFLLWCICFAYFNRSSLTKSFIFSLLFFSFLYKNRDKTEVLNFRLQKRIFSKVKKQFFYESNLNFKYLLDISTIHEENQLLEFVKFWRTVKVVLNEHF